MTDEFERAFLGAQNVERVNGLIYAVVMESRGVYMSAEISHRRKRYGDLLLKFNERIAKVVADWRKHVGGRRRRAVRRIRQAHPAVHGIPQGAGRGSAAKSAPPQGREWGDNEANRSVRTALNKDLDVLAAIYDARSKQVYARAGSRRRAHRCGCSALLCVVCVMLAAIGIVIIGARSRARSPTSRA